MREGTSTVPGFGVRCPAEAGHTCTLNSLTQRDSGLRTQSLSSLHIGPRRFTINIYFSSLANRYRDRRQRTTTPDTPQSRSQYDVTGLVMVYHTYDMGTSRRVRLTSKVLSYEDFTPRMQTARPKFSRPLDPHLTGVVRDHTIRKR